VRILHTSDWHLGRIFHSVYLTDDQAYLLEQFVNLIPQTKPDVIVIAGDIYDRSVPPVEAVKLLDETLSKILLDYRVPIVLLAGNHDSPERLSFGNRLLGRQGLHIISQIGNNLGPLVFEDQYGPVYFCPVPYAEPVLVRERLGLADISDHNAAMMALVQRIAGSIPSNARKIAVAHAFITGSQTSESERPLSVGGAGNVDAACFDGFNYVALGHLHQPQRAGQEHIRYSGSLMKYSFSEAAHNKSINLVDLDGDGKVTVDSIGLSPRRDLRCIEGYLSDILQGPQNGENRDDYIMVTLKDSGAIYDAIGQLRQVYPNILHIERPYLTVDGRLSRPAGDYRQISELELFASFYEQVTGEQLGEEEKTVLADILEQLRAGEREVAV